MATRNPWANWAPPAQGSTGARNRANARRNTPTTPRKSNGMPPLFPSLFTPPPPPGPGTRPNAIQAALMRVGGNAVTNQFSNSPMAQNGGGGGGGGGGRGGGGGGAAPPAVTQAMIDALTQALGVQGPKLGYTPLPAFQGQSLGAFNPAPYNTQRGLVDQAVAADQANINTNQVATTQAVQGAYSNPYATAQVQAGPQTGVVGGGLMGSVGGAASPDMANQMNAQNGQDRGTFQDLLKVLGASQQASQGSRMQQVAMDANYGRQQANAQALGLRGGIANQQAQAANTWQQQAAEREYQNNLMRQQWAQQNAQGQQSVNQANWQQANTTQTARLQPILDLISQSANIPGLNFAKLIAAVQGRAA
jgi:hypothetical protein